MRRLLCTFNSTNVRDTDIWSTIVQMDHLEILDLDGDLKYPILTSGSLPKLKQLTMCINEGIQGFLNSLDGSDLTDLRIFNGLGNFEDLVQSILRFRKLRTLHYNINGGNVLTVIKGLPLLVVLATDSNVSQSVEMLRDLDAYLRQTKRRLSLELYAGNSIEFCY